MGIAGSAATTGTVPAMATVRHYRHVKSNFDSSSEEIEQKATLSDLNQVKQMFVKTSCYTVTRVDRWDNGLCVSFDDNHSYIECQDGKFLNSICEHLNTLLPVHVPV